MKTRVTFALLVASMALGCSSDPAPQTSAPTQPIPTQLPAALTATQFLAYEANVECAAMFSCVSASQVSALRVYLGDYTRCVARADVLPGDSSRRRQAALVAAGRMRFDEAAGRRCLEAQRASMCEIPSACEAVFVGATALGAECTDRDECAGDATCATTDGSGSSMCPGRCQTRLAVGALCDGNDSSCSQVGATGTVRCLYDPTISDGHLPFRCTEGAPVQRVPEGGDCSNVGTTGQSPPCATGLDCRYINSGSQVRQLCVAPSPEGEACSRYCQTGSLCEFDNTRFEQRCLPFTVRNREGETCVQGNNGSEVCNVLLGLDCVAGHCRRVGTGAENSVCFSGRFNVTSCNPGLYCSLTTGTCQRRKADGATCSTSDECESGTCGGDTAGNLRCLPLLSSCG